VSASDDLPPQRTPLYDLHAELGARIVPFAGYAMPLQYKGIIAEHQHARTAAALFDVSHMGQATLAGDATDAFDRLVVGDLRALATGKIRYTVLTNERGGIIDDLMVTQGGHYLALVVNAARKDVDFRHIRAHLPGGSGLEVHEDRALLALQGPLAATVLARLAPASRLMLFMTTESLRIGDLKCTISRSGYTGEDGFEISVAAEDAMELARMLLHEPEVAPAGLGARDTLRLEAGFCLYGNDIDEGTTPIEAGLAWIIDRRRREEGGFLGDDVILRQLVEGPPRKRVGIRLDGRVPARAGAGISDGDGRPIGTVTSGGFAPTLGHPIAMGYVEAGHAAPGTHVDVLVRDKPMPGRIVRLPFVEHRYRKA
jgi:aminomethyltransferase